MHPNCKGKTHQFSHHLWECHMVLEGHHLVPDLKERVARSRSVKLFKARFGWPNTGKRLSCLTSLTALAMSIYLWENKTMSGSWPFSHFIHAGSWSAIQSEYPTTQHSKNLVFSDKCIINLHIQFCSVFDSTQINIWLICPR